MLRHPVFGLRFRLILLVLLAVLPVLGLVILEVSDRIEFRHLLGIGFVLLLSLAAAWFGGDLIILRRVRSLIRATQRIAHGDLSARTDLPYGQGELSQLARSFDEMAETIKLREEAHLVAEKKILNQNRDLTALMTVTAAVSSSLELPEILESVKHLLAENLNVPGGALFLYSEEENSLIVQAAWGIPASVFSDFKRFSADCYHYKQVITTKEVYLKQDFRTVEPYCEKRLDVLRPRWLGFLCVPLLAKGEVQGVLDLFSQAPATFTTDQSVLFTTLGQQVGVAVQHARLFEQIRNSRRRLQVLSQQSLQVQESERRHIARELHDEIGQALTAIKVNLQTAQRLSEKPTLAPHLEESISIVQNTLQQVRDLSLELRPSLLDDLGVISALRWYIDRQAQRAGFNARFTAIPSEMKLPPDVETTCFRIVQEAITNIVRHADAKNVSVGLEKKGTGLFLTIQDDGVGFNVDAVIERASGDLSFGLLGMHERAQLIGGQFKVESDIHKGTIISALFPTQW